MHVSAFHTLVVWAAPLSSEVVSGYGMHVSFCCGFCDGMLYVGPSLAIGRGKMVIGSCSCCLIVLGRDGVGQEVVKPNSPPNCSFMVQDVLPSSFVGLGSTFRMVQVRRSLRFYNRVCH